MASDIRTYVIEVSGITISMACRLIYFKGVKTIAYKKFT